MSSIPPPADQASPPLEGSGRLRGGRIDYVQMMIRAERDEEMIALAARCILQEFDLYYVESRGIPARAKAAFERGDPAESLQLSRRRLSIYSESFRELTAQLERVFSQLSNDEHLWQKVEQQYYPLIAGRYEEDLAIAFIHSVRRMIFRDEWRPVDYSFGRAARSRSTVHTYIHRDFPGGARLKASTVAEILALPGFSVPFRDLAGDCERVARRVNEELGFDGRDPEVIRVVQIIDAGFYRNRGAYLVGRIVLRERSLRPLVLSLENDAVGGGGIFVDAVLTGEADCHNIFSSTLANFHVTDPHYHELAAFLHDIMPRRALGLHYTTIGFNHVGKVAVMGELRAELTGRGERLDTAVGARGSVAIGFSAPSSDYVLKVVRDTPTDQYKWGRFDGIDSVLAKYRRVHEINRTGSMLDNMIFTNITLQRAWFAPELCAELLADAGKTVSALDSPGQEPRLLFKHLIVQPKMIPLPVFLETATPAQADLAVIGLGDCIKNNAAANIFNKDLDGRNYGVSRYLKVYLFDYDALEVFTEVKIRTNLDREEGEEDIPDWFFEEGVVFLPEEIESGLRLTDRRQRRLFRQVHGDLATPRYWEALQEALRRGRVPRISLFPEARRLAPPDRDGQPTA